MRESLDPLSAYLSTIAQLDEQCQEANIEENDYTTYTYDELSYEFGLVQSSVSKKLSFLENQMVARNMTNLTPIQLEEFESVFRHFDRSLRNALSEIEFSAALASLGLVYDEGEMHEVFLKATKSNNNDGGGGGSTTVGGSANVKGEVVTFEQFIHFMVEVTEDQNTAEQVFQSFREVADGKPYVTELDLRHSLVPEEVIALLKESLPVVDGDGKRIKKKKRRPNGGADGDEGGGTNGEGEEGHGDGDEEGSDDDGDGEEVDDPKFDYVAFMDTFTGGGGGGPTGHVQDGSGETSNGRQVRDTGGGGGPPGNGSKNGGGGWISTKGMNGLG